MRKFYVLAAVSLVFFLCSCANLMYNAQVGDIEGLEKGLNYFPIEQKNARGDTALIVAAYSNKPQAVAYLLKRGADVNARNDDGATALTLAAYYNLLDVAEILVKHNADQTIKDKYGNTPLNYAEQYEYTRMISLLKNQ